MFERICEVHGFAAELPTTMADYFARANDFQVKLRRGDPKAAITALKFSPNQEFLGTCDDAGIITV